MNRDSIRKSISATILLASIALPLSLYAQFDSGEFGGGGQYFGGRQTMIYNEGMCNCSGTNVHVIMDDATNGELMLYYDGSGRLYDSGNIDNIGGEQLGSYQSTTTECQEYVGEDCITIATATGTYNSMPGTGTSGMGADSSVFKYTHKLIADTARQITNTLSSSNAKT